MLSWATLKATRCGALRCAMPTIAVAVARSSTATGNPQNSMAATLMVRDTAGDSGPDLPGVTIRHISPARIIALTTQNIGELATERTSRTIAGAVEASNTAPTADTAVR